MARHRDKVKVGQIGFPASDWFPASGGTETPFMTRNGRRLLYVWQPSTGAHAYLDLDTDIILTDAEARSALGTF